MSSLPSILVDFTTAAQARFGADAAGHNDDGAFIAVGDRMVHVNLDQSANRAVVWTELARPEHAEIEALETVAMAYTSREFLSKGLTLGINRVADLIVLGRSIEQDALAFDEGLDLVTSVAEAAGPAGAALAEASRPSNGHSQPRGGDAIIFRT
jgi:hypothetical protein